MARLILIWHLTVNLPTLCYHSRLNFFCIMQKVLFYAEIPESKYLLKMKVTLFYAKSTEFYAVFLQIGNSYSNDFCTIGQIYCAKNVGYLGCQLTIGSSDKEKRDFENKSRSSWGWKYHKKKKVPPQISPLKKTFKKAAHIEHYA